MENLKLNLEEGSTSFWGSALHYQSAITMRFREVVDDRHAGILLKVNEVSLACLYVKSAANFNERHGDALDGRLPPKSSPFCPVKIAGIFAAEY